MSFHAGSPLARQRLLATVAATLALTLAALGLWMAARAADATATPPTAARHAIGPATRFDHVAVFPAGTPAAAIEQWRRTVLAPVHAQACASGRSCLLRALRLSALGTAHAEVLAFDLAADTPPVERSSLLLLAATAQPQARLCHACTPLQATTP